MAKSKSLKSFKSKRFGIYLLGAGFSRPAGLPLANELWQEVMKRGLALKRRAGACFRNDLEAYREYRKKCDGTKLKMEDINFEEFLAYLDVEFYLGLRGKDTWSFHGNETQVVIKTLIGNILAERMPSDDNIPENYLQFAKILKPDDYVLTFNYDTLLERALDKAGVSFRMFADRYKEDSRFPDLCIIDDSRDEVVVLKLHGSIDWFDNSLYEELEKDRILHGLPPGGAADLIFQKPERFGAVPLLEGPRYPQDPLKNIFRVKHIKNLYSKEILFHSTPSLLNPSSMKILFSKMVKDFWWGLGRAGVTNFSMAIIGFSLPIQDEYARQVLYRLITNYQTAYWGDTTTWMHRKTKLVLIDFRTSAKQEREYRRRYNFVNWNRAVTYFKGFNKEAIKLLRPSK